MNTEFYQHFNFNFVQNCISQKVLHIAESERANLSVLVKSPFKPIFFLKGEKSF
jgi:hypothetical protein